MIRRGRSVSSSLPSQAIALANKEVEKATGSEKSFGCRCYSMKTCTSLCLHGHLGYTYRTGKVAVSFCSQSLALSKNYLTSCIGQEGGGDGFCKNCNGCCQGHSAVL